MLRFFVFGHKYQSGTIFPFFGNRDSLQKNELMGYLYHNTCTVAGFAVGAFCSTVLHVFQHSEGGVN